MPEQIEHPTTFNHIVNLIDQARSRAFASVNAELITLYFSVGKVVAQKVEFSQWGSATVDQLSEWNRISGGIADQFRLSLPGIQTTHCVSYE
jgi:hypothetical protein